MSMSEAPGLEAISAAHHLPVIARPSSYLHPQTAPRPVTPAKQLSSVDREQVEALVRFRSITTHLQMETLTS